MILTRWFTLEATERFYKNEKLELKFIDFFCKSKVAQFEVFKDNEFSHYLYVYIFINNHSREDVGFTTDKNILKSDYKFDIKNIYERKSDSYIVYDEGFDEANYQTDP